MPHNIEQTRPKLQESQSNTNAGIYSKIASYDKQNITKQDNSPTFGPRRTTKLQITDIQVENTNFFLQRNKTDNHLARNTQNTDRAGTDRAGVVINESTIRSGLGGVPWHSLNLSRINNYLRHGTPKDISRNDIINFLNKDDTKMDDLYDKDLFVGHVMSLDKKLILQLLTKAAKGKDIGLIRTILLRLKDFSKSLIKNAAINEQEELLREILNQYTDKDLEDPQIRNFITKIFFEVKENPLLAKIFHERVNIRIDDIKGAIESNNSILLALYLETLQKTQNFRQEDTVDLMNTAIKCKNFEAMKMLLGAQIPHSLYQLQQIKQTAILRDNQEILLKLRHFPELALDSTQEKENEFYDALDKYAETLINNRLSEEIKKLGNNNHSNIFTQLIESSRNILDTGPIHHKEVLHYIDGIIMSEHPEFNDVKHEILRQPVSEQTKNIVKKIIEIKKEISAMSHPHPTLNISVIPMAPPTPLINRTEAGAAGVTLIAEGAAGANRATLGEQQDREDEATLIAEGADRADRATPKQQQAEEQQDGVTLIAEGAAGANRATPEQQQAEEQQDGVTLIAEGAAGATLGEQQDEATFIAAEAAGAAEANRATPGEQQDEATLIAEGAAGANRATPKQQQAEEQQDGVTLIAEGAAGANRATPGEQQDREDEATLIAEGADRADRATPKQQQAEVRPSEIKSFLDTIKEEGSEKRARSLSPMRKDSQNETPRRSLSPNSFRRGKKLADSCKGLQ